VGPKQSHFLDCDVVAHRLAQFLAVATFLLLFIGGLVTSTDSGLAVPDWPLSYGTFFPPMVGGIRYEHTHRLIALTVGLLTLILTIWMGKTEPRRFLRWLAIAAFGAVVLQGVLGGMTVLFRLPWPISVAHACLGPIFFCLVVALAVLTDPNHKTRVSGVETLSFHRLCLVTTGLVFLQILLGATVRHTGGGVWFHVSGAFVVFISAGLLLTRALNDFPNRMEVLRPTLFLGFLVTAEFFLGIAAFVFTQIQGIPSGLAPIIFPTLHQTLGALILAVSVVLTLRLSFTQEPSLQGGRLADARLPARQEAIQKERLPASPSGRGLAMTAYLELTKPRLVFLVLWTVTVGFLLGTIGPLDLWLLLRTLVGTGLVAAGSMALNQYLERESDARMKRTQNRPLPRGRLEPKQALAFGLFLSLTGLLVLAFSVNLLTCFLSALTLVSYLFLYTPLKQRTPWSTLAGALPGAIPPMLGWGAARGELGWEAWVLFSILFIWQLPHFFAIAWIYREDYKKAGFQMLSVVDPTGERIGRQMMLYSLALFLSSLVPPVAGMTGLVYYLAAFLLGIWFLGASFLTAFKLDSRSLAFFRSSVLYLTLILFFLVLDKNLT